MHELLPLLAPVLSTTLEFSQLIGLSHIGFLHRVTGQGTTDELKGRDLRQELLERETSHLKSIGRAVPALRTKAPPLLPPG